MDLSIVIATRNRIGPLSRTLRTLLAQQTCGACFEVVVVDNGSTDTTREAVEAMSRPEIPIRYVFEGALGPSRARNAGIAVASAPIIGFVDDDEDIAPNWVAEVCRAFREHPEVDIIGGRVLPRWPATPPSWITPLNRGALSIIDRGNEPFLVDRSRWMCFGAGNMACRREALDDVGWFSDVYARSQDRELLLRFLLAGRKGLYVPGMIVVHHLEVPRLTKSHFRRWSRMEGRMRAAYRFEEMFTRDGELRPLSTHIPMVLGAPRFLYRQLAVAWLRWARAFFGFRSVDAFRHEMRAVYLWNYIRRRRQIRAPLLPPKPPSPLPAPAVDEVRIPS